VETPNALKTDAMHDDAPKNMLSEPGGHAVHTERPEIALKNPKEQNKQPDIPCSAVYEPAGHDEQTELDTAPTWMLNVPAEHKVEHEDWPVCEL
jgi:hypothetical protein